MREITSQQNPSLHGEFQPVFEEQETSDLRDYWFVIYRHRHVALTFVLLTLFFTLISVRWDDPLYTARTTLYIQGELRGVFDGPEVAATRFNNIFETQRKLLTSRSLAAEVIKGFGLEDNPHFTKTSQSILAWFTGQLSLVTRTVVRWATDNPLVTLIKGYLGVTSKSPSKPLAFELGVHPSLVDQYLSKLTVAALPDSQLVQVQFTSSDPMLSKAVVSRHVMAFIETNLATRFDLTDETRKFLEGKLVELKANVENSERALNRFQTAHEVVSLDKGGSLPLEELKKLNTDLTEARSRRIELESLHRIVQKKDNQLLSQIIDNPRVQQLRNQITNLETQVSHLQTKFKPTYRGIIALQQEIDEAKSRLNGEINRIVQSIERDYLAAIAKEKALAAETDRARRVALSLQEKAVEYAVLEREVASNRALYEAVFKKTKEAALTGEGPMPNLRIVDRAEIPVAPDSGKSTRILVLAIVLGLLGGIGLAFLLHFLDNSIRTPDDVARSVRLPTLGIVPDFVQLANGHGHRLGYTRAISHRSSDRSAKHNELVAFHHPLSLMAEIYRSICTAILFSKRDKPPQTILVTSSQANEGKTVTAINVAMMLGQSRGPVLLIDADLHGGQCHRRLGLENGTGLTNVLTGNGDANRLIKKTSIKNLSLLGRGTLPPNPADLLGSETMRQTLNTLAADFRFIVIDSAPLVPVTDSMLLATQVDGVILVARGDGVSRNVIRKARERLDYVNAKILGVVLNGIDIFDAEYGEYRSVYQSHYIRYAEKTADEFWTGVPLSAGAAADILPAGSPETLPPGFFNRMLTIVTEFAGPMAPVILRDRIAALGESIDAFSQSRLQELIDAVGCEIWNEEMRVAFTKRVSEEMRNFIIENNTAPVPSVDQTSA